MAYDVSPLVKALLRWRDLRSFAELERKTAAIGKPVSSASIGRTASGKTQPSPETWEALYEAVPDFFPPPPWGTPRATDAPVFVGIDGDSDGNVFPDYETAEEAIARVAELHGLDTLKAAIDKALGKIAPLSGASSDYVQVKHLNVTASGGAGALNGDEHIVESLAFRRDWLVGKKGLSPEKVACIDVEGDSMSPTLQPGDLIMVDTTQTKVSRGGLFVIRQDDNLMVKRLLPVGGGKVQVVSDNQQYPAFEAVLGKDLEVAGRVVWYCRDVV